MACRLLGGKPLPEPMLTYWQLGLQEQISATSEGKHKTFYSWKYLWKCRLHKWRSFCPGGGAEWDELTMTDIICINNGYMLHHLPTMIPQARHVSFLHQVCCLIRFSKSSPEGIIFDAWKKWCNVLHHITEWLTNAGIGTTGFTRVLPCICGKRNPCHTEWRYIYNFIESS